MKKIILHTTILLLLISCSKKQLDLKNPNSKTFDTYWKTEEDIQSALGATYGLLKNVDGGLWGVRGVELSNGRGDDFFIRNDVSYLYQLSTFTNTPDNSAATNIWNIAYRGIFRANQIIENIDKVTSLSEQAKKAYIAEAKFLRGLNYFILVTNFGDVPLRNSIPKTAEENAVAKSPEAEVWKQLIKDFQEAQVDLPVSYPKSWAGRATKGAAIAYWGKAYLYTKDYAKAEATLLQLTQAPFSYQLMSDFGDNFIPTKENNAESVFEIQLSDVGGTNPWAGENANEGLGVTTAQEFAPSEVAGWFEVSPTDKLFNEFQVEKTVSGAIDPRMYATLVWNYPNATFYTKPFTDFTLQFGFKSMYKKYQNYWKVNELTGDNGGSYTSSNNERAMRYADVLLMLAEAITMQQRPVAAYTHVNAVRSRAQLSPLAAGFSTTQMMAEIRHQRMLEFAREGLRFYDLKRWGLLQQEITNSDKVGKQFYNPTKHEYFPIPQSELNANPKMEQSDPWK